MPFASGNRVRAFRLLLLVKITVTFIQRIKFSRIYAFLRLVHASYLIGQFYYCAIILHSNRSISKYNFYFFAVERAPKRAIITHGDLAASGLLLLSFCEIRSFRYFFDKMVIPHNRT